MDATKLTFMEERVQKIIANAGCCSRRKAEDLIIQGLVKVNGKTITIGDKATASDNIFIDGKKLDTSGKKIYLLLHKPAEYVCTAYDPRGRKRIIDLVSSIDSRLFSVGRLDYDATGALIMTNDGDFANKIMHPRYECPKVYEVHLRRPLSEKDIAYIQKGVEIDGKTVKCELSVMVPNKVLVSLHVGIHKVVKRIFKEVDNYVRRLKRISIGPVELGKLKPGEFRPLTLEEINYFMRL